MVHRQYLSQRLKSYDSNGAYEYLNRKSYQRTVNSCDLVFDLRTSQCTITLNKKRFKVLVIILVRCQGVLWGPDLRILL